MSDTRSAEEIERDIERERQELQQTLAEIRDRYSPENLARQVGRQFQEHGGDIGRSVLRSVKENPVPLALTAIGIAWLMSGRSGRVSWPERHEDHHRDPYRVSDPALRRDRAIAGVWRDDGWDHDEGRASYGSAYGSARGTDGDSADWQNGFTSSGDLPSSQHSPRGEGAGERLRRAREAAQARWEETEQRQAGGWAEGGAGTRSRTASTWEGGRRQVADSWHAMRDRLLGGWSSARHGTSHLARSSRASAAELAERIYEGTSDLSEEAARRVVAARKAAYEAQLKLEEAWQRGVHEASDFYAARPLVVGALAVAAGAALGSLLPRTSIEDEAVGAESDQLFAEANRIYREERRKVAKVAEAAANAAVETAREERDKLSGAVRDQVEKAGDELRSAVDKVTDKTREEARRQGLTPNA